MIAKPSPTKIYLDASIVKDQEECIHCRQNLHKTNHLKWFQINPHTDIYKCERAQCLFPFKQFIYRDRDSQALYRIGIDATPSGCDRSSAFTNLSADIDSYIRQYDEKGVPKSSEIDDILIDLFPESANEGFSNTTTEDPLQIQEPSSSSYSEKYTKVELIPSLLQDLEGSYKCKACERKCLQKNLIFLRINETTEVFKCESPSCLFPFRNFIYRDREKQSYFRYKAMSTSTTKCDSWYSSSEFEVPAIPPSAPQVAEVIPEMEEISFDFLTNTEYKMVTVQSIVNKTPTKPPIILENRVLTPRKSIAELKSMKTKPIVRPRPPIVGRKIPTPLELIRNLLNRKEVIEETVAAEAMEATSKSSQIHITASTRKPITKVPERSPNILKKRQRLVLETTPETSVLPVLEPSDPSPPSIPQKSPRKPAVVDKEDYSITDSKMKPTEIEKSIEPTKTDVLPISRKRGRSRSENAPSCAPLVVENVVCHKRRISKAKPNEKDPKVMEKVSKALKVDKTVKNKSMSEKLGTKLPKLKVSTKPISAPEQSQTIPKNGGRSKAAANIKPTIKTVEIPQKKGPKPDIPSKEAINTVVEKETPLIPRPVILRKRGRPKKESQPDLITEEKPDTPVEAPTKRVRRKPR